MEAIATATLIFSALPHPVGPIPIAPAAAQPAPESRAEIGLSFAPVVKREGSIDHLITEADLAVATAQKLNRSYAVYGVTKAVATTKALVQAATRA